MNARPRTASAPKAPLGLLGLACAVGVSTIYYNQPLLLDMAHSLHADHGRIGLVAMATQVGYAVGLLSFVPLGDVLERRALMMRMYGAVAVALVLVSLAPSLLWLMVGSVVAGALASVTHVALPIAPDLVNAEQRGRAVGTVMTGLLLGVLLARTFAGWVSKLGNWRTVFVAAAVMNAAFVPLLWKRMPKLPPRQQLSYGGALRSLWTLFRTEPLLRESSAMGGLCFGAFSVFWTTLVLLLGAKYGLGAGVAGTFGVVGAGGATVAPIAGRLSDKHGSRWVVTVAGATMMASFVMMWAEERLRMSTALHMAALVVSVIVLDVGMQMLQVANQTRIFGLHPGARSRINTVYMVNYFIGGAIGSGTGAWAWTRWGWNGVCATGMVFLALAALRHATGVRTVGPSHWENVPAEERVFEI